MIIGYCIGCGYGGVHCGEPRVRIKRIKRALTQALSRHSAALRAGDVVDIKENLGMFNSHRREARTEAVCKENEESERSIDRKKLLCMKRSYDRRRLLNRELNATITAFDC